MGLGTDCVSGNSPGGYWSAAPVPSMGQGGLWARLWPVWGTPADNGETDLSFPGYHCSHATAWEWPGGGERHVSRVPRPCRAKVPFYHLLRPKAACGRRSVRGLHVPLHQAWEPAAPTRPLQTCGCTSARPCTRHAGHPRTLTAGHPRGLPLCPESSAWLHASPSTTTLREAP